jgi:hypothetical protein
LTWRTSVSSGGLVVIEGRVSAAGGCFGVSRFVMLLFEIMSARPSLRPRVLRLRGAWTGQLFSIHPFKNVIHKTRFHVFKRPILLTHSDSILISLNKRENASPETKFLHNFDSTIPTHKPTKPHTQKKRIHRPNRDLRSVTEVRSQKPETRNQRESQTIKPL